MGTLRVIVRVNTGSVSMLLLCGLQHSTSWVSVLPDLIMYPTLMTGIRRAAGSRSPEPLGNARWQRHGDHDGGDRLDE